MTDDLLGLEPEEAAAPASDPEVERLRREKRELLAELKAFKAEKKQAFLSKHPFLTEEDVKDLPVARLETIFAKFPQSTQAVETTAEAAPPQTTPDPAPSSFVAAAALHGQDVATDRTITFAEAKKMGGLDNPVVREMALKGLVEGVSPRR